MFVFSHEEIEMLQVSVWQRYERWVNTEVYLKVGSVVGPTEECHKVEEAQWMCERYLRLARRLDTMFENRVNETAR